MPSQTATTEYKADIMQRLGGENMFEFVLLGLVERLRSDPTLENFFSNFDSKSLEVHQRTFLTAVFAVHPEDYDVESFITLRHYGLINRGFSGKHFDMLVKHLVNAMNDAWVREEVVADVVRILTPFRRIFGDDVAEEEQEEEQELVGIVVPVKDESSNNDKKSASRERKTVGRTFSGEGLLKMMRLKGAKRTKLAV
jgi:truncated hemoglobin YjbI